MAGYIGSAASVVSSGAENKKTFTITGATTSLTGLNYTVGKVHVFQNGVRLVDGTDYTATNGTAITLTVAAQSGDNVVVISQADFQVSGAVSTSGDSMTGNLSLGDNNKAIFGAGDDLQIYHDGSHSYIAEGGSATGSLRIRGENLLLEDNSGKDYLNAVADAQVELSHNGVKKFETTSTGVDVTGKINAINGEVHFSGNISTPNQGVAMYRPETNTLGFVTDASERMRIDSSGRLLSGTSSSRTVQGFHHNVQVEGTNASTASISVVRNTNSVDPPYITFGKTRSGSVGASGVVQQNDVLGRIDFTGANGSNLNSLGARIDARVDGTPGGSDMPTRLTFQTSADGSANPIERMRIDSSGRVTTPSQPAFMARLDTSFTVGPNPTTLPAGTAVYNIGGHYSTGTYRFTAPVAGRYLFASNIQYQTNGGSHINLYVNMNASFAGQGWIDLGTTTGVTQTMIHNLAAGDYVQAMIYHTSANTIVSTGRTKWMGYLIG